MIFILTAEGEAGPQDVRKLGLHLDQHILVLLQLGLPNLEGIIDHLLDRLFVQGEDDVD